MGIVYKKLEQAIADIYNIANYYSTQAVKKLHIVKTQDVSLVSKFLEVRYGLRNPNYTKLVYEGDRHSEPFGKLCKILDDESTEVLIISDSVEMLFSDSNSCKKLIDFLEFNERSIVIIVVTSIKNISSTDFRRVEELAFNHVINIGSYGKK